MDGEGDIVQSDSAHGRRAFLKRMAAFTFAAPVIGSFLLDSDAFADGHDQHGKHSPNQYGQNQTQGSGPGYGQKPPPNQYGQNQTQGQPCGPDGQGGKNNSKGDKSQRRR
jgi:hypothetical protein